MTTVCKACGHASDVDYRCEKCGKDLAKTDTETVDDDRAALGDTGGDSDDGGEDSE